jgi:hypothetical protein
MSKVVSSNKTTGANLVEPGSIVGFEDGPQVYSSAITTQKTVYVVDTAVTIPANVTSVSFKLWGAGGNSGEAAASGTLNGSGGGGGYAEYIGSPVPGDVYQLSVGQPSGGGAGGVVTVPAPYNGGNGGGMSLVHLKSGSNYIIKAVAGGGGGGGSAGGGLGISGSGGGTGGGAFSDNGGAGSNGIGGSGSGSLVAGSNGANFINPVATIPPIGVGGVGGVGSSTNPYNKGGGGGGGSGYGGGGGGGLELATRSGGGGGGGLFSASGTVISTGSRTAAASNDVDYPPGVGMGALSDNTGLTQVGAAGAIVVTYTIRIQSLGLPDETALGKASSFIVSAANNLQAGTLGDGGDLRLNAGSTAATAPAVAGSVLVSGVRLAPASDNAVALGGPTNRWSTVYAATATINTSDKREKDDIVPLPIGLDFVNQLNPVQYRLRDGIRPHYGFLAQDIKDVLDARQIDFGGYVRAEKYSIDPATGENVPDGYVLGLRYEEFIAPLTKAVQELAVESEANKARLMEFSKAVACREEIDELKTHISQLESLVANLQSQLEKIETPP